MRFSLTPWLALACALVHGGSARAETPDYGRPQRTPATRPLDVAARVVMFPAWLVTDLVIRRPLGAAVRGVESSDVLQSAGETSSAGPWKQLTILPAARFDVGLKPILGVNASWRYRRHSALLQAGTWGPAYVVARAEERLQLRAHDELSFEATFTRRRDLPFFGLGPRSRGDDRARYQANAVRVQTGYATEFWRASRIAVALGGRALWFGNDACCSEPSVRQQVASGRIQAPGLDQDYSASFQRLELTLDSRPRTARRGPDVRLDAYQEATFTLDTPPSGSSRRAWMHYGGALSASLDLTGTRRFLTLSAHARFADPLQNAEIPFTDLVTVGGDRLMPGFLRGRLTDRSAAVASLDYTWPFWVFMDGVVQASVGNVFGAHLRDIDVRSMRWSSSLGFRTTGDPRSRLEATFGVASTPFDEGGKIDSVRFMVGTQHGL